MVHKARARAGMHSYKPAAPMILWAAREKHYKDGLNAERGIAPV